MKNIKNKRTVFAFVFMALQLLAFGFMIFKMSTFSAFVYILFRIAGILAAVSVSLKTSELIYRFSWLTIVFAFPVTGWIFWFLFERRKIRRQLQCRCNYAGSENKKILRSDVYMTAKLINFSTGIKPGKYTETKYYPCGENFFEDFISDLKKACKSVYMEYFIVNPGYMWNQIYDIISEKVKKGVDVRLIYDDMCCVIGNKEYLDKLKKSGIKLISFNKMKPFPDAGINYRDHRKMTVIDGITAYAGGINISDEYINKKERFGYWKDCAVRLKGESVYEMSVMFEQMWNKYSDDKIKSSLYCVLAAQGNGLTQPFPDIPGEQLRLSEMVYLRLINSAKEKICITTPYLILENEIATALESAAMSGVDVRIITPHIPDKKCVHAVTQSNYRPLIQNGVRIYEYTPGFIHAKSLIADSRYAVIGSANFDYRSFHMLYENSVFMYKTSAVKQMETDFNNTLSKCTEITSDTLQNMKKIKIFIGEILKNFSPLM